MNATVLNSSVLKTIAVCLLLAVGCQKSDQSSVQPEKLASSAPTATATAAPVAASGVPQPGAGASGGPLLPYAKGHGPQPKSSASNIKPGEVKLLEAGAEPRRELRLATKAGQTEQMEMTMTLDIGMELDGKKTPSGAMPPMIMLMDMTVNDAKPNGDIAYSFVLSQTDIPPVKGANAQAQKAIGMMKKGLAQLVGLKGNAIVSDRGFTKDVDIKLPGDANPAVQQIMQGMEQALNQIGAPFPDEAVGVGAKWQFANNMDQNGVKLTQVATYNLEKVNDDRVVLGVQINQFAPKQKVNSPMGVTVDLVKLSSKGGGKTKLALNRVSPLKSVIQLASDVSMAIPDGQKIKMMKVNTKMKLEVVAPAKKK